MMAAVDFQQMLIGVTGQADQTVRELGEFGESGRAFALGGA